MCAKRKLFDFDPENSESDADFSSDDSIADPDYDESSRSSEDVSEEKESVSFLCVAYDLYAVMNVAWAFMSVQIYFYITTI